MIGKIALSAVAVVAFTAGPAAAKTIQEAVAHCHELSGIPLGGTHSPDPASEPRVRLVTNPDWLRRPTADDMAAANPARAGEYQLNGSATVHCLVGVDGRVRDCTVMAEAPKGKDFGAAAIKVAGMVRLIPKLVDCEPVDGAEVTFPINFAYPGYR